MALYGCQYLNFCTLIVVSQFYDSEIISEYVIRGNNAVLKCNIPAFVADFVSVTSWIDSDNNLFEIESGGEIYHFV